LSETVINIENLGKQYQLGGRGASYATFRDVLANMFRFKNCASRTKTREYIWALKDINVKVGNGEVVGIIGRNGAGKSTLLKILSRITDPSEGKAIIKGRVGSLLEVGVGFHPELTGRENILLNGAILGMFKKEIEVKFDEIVAFAELEKFIDTPVKFYSSGMYVRLAFAVAAHLEPEILLVDEVLAVGDINFQKKCLGKMGDVAKSGRTILFVSHNMGAIRQLCSRVIQIEDGTIKRQGDVSMVTNGYLQDLLGSEEGDSLSFSVEEDASTVMQVTKGRIYSSGEIAGACFDVFDTISIEFEFHVTAPISGYSLYCQILRNGEVLFVSFDTSEKPEYLEQREPDRYKTTFTLPSPLLKPGSYSVDIFTGRPGTLPTQKLENIMRFEVDLNSKQSLYLSYSKDRPGVVAVPLEWDTVKI